MRKLDKQEYNVHNVYILIHLQLLNYFPDEVHLLDKEQYMLHIRNSDHRQPRKYGLESFPQPFEKVFIEETSSMRNPFPMQTDIHTRTPSFPLELKIDGNVLANQFIE